MKVVSGKHTGLPFPANAEIVLEGFVIPATRRRKARSANGPATTAPTMRAEPVLDIKAIYHRNDPIILGCPPQRPPDELARYRAVMRSALLKESIGQGRRARRGRVWCHEVGGARMFTAVSIKQRYPGHATPGRPHRRQCRVGAYAGKYVVVVDDDIDVTNLEELMWAMLHALRPGDLDRHHPQRLVHAARSVASRPSDKERGNFTNSRAIIDACRPFHWKDQYPNVNTPLPEIARKAKEKFGWLLEGIREKTKEC